MLLSMFTSFLLARRFHRKAYVFLMAAGLVFTSFFSVGLPHYYSERIIADTESGLLLENPVPLSFPFYASLYFERVSIAHNFRHLGFDKETYQLHFLTLILHDFLVYKRYWGGLAGSLLFMKITWGHYILFISFFSLVNIVGVIIGYWLSKTTFIEKLFKKRTNQ